jgi:hypothetical protein
MITGRLRSAIVSAPARTTRPIPSKLTNTPSPRSPYTTEGTPARLEMLTFSAVVQRLRGAYSSMKIAVPTPMGNAIRAVNEITQSVPNRAELSPARSGRRDGMFVIKSQLSHGIPRSRTVQSSVPSAMIPTHVAARNTQRMMPARVLRTATCRDVRPSCWLAEGVAPIIRRPP